MTETTTTVAVTQSAAGTPIFTYQKPPFTVSTDPQRLDLNVIHTYLYHCYWSPGIPRELVAQAIQHSLNFGLYEENQQIGFARVVTDYTSFAYLADVFVLPTHRQQGLGVWLIDCVITCPVLQTIRSFLLATRDAHGLYRKFGFENADERRIMIKRYEIPWRDQTLIQE